MIMFLGRVPLHSFAGYRTAHSSCAGRLHNLFYLARHTRVKASLASSVHSSQTDWNSLSVLSVLAWPTRVPGVFSPPVWPILIKTTPTTGVGILNSAFPNLYARGAFGNRAYKVNIQRCVFIQDPHILKHKD
jgi:hypothetical protein